MAFTLTWQDRARHLSDRKHQYFTYTCLAGDTSITVSPPSMADRVDYVLIDGVSRTAADSISGATATLTVKVSGQVTYSATVGSSTATVGTTYYDANGNLFSVAATIASQTTVALTGPAAVAPSGTLTKASGMPAGDAATLVVSAVAALTLYGTGCAVGI